MGKKLKRGVKGNAVNYVTRSRAIKKLQVSLKDFRRLCIFKGIHPREPRKKKHGADKTYYHAKDLRWLAHEPVLHKLRNQKAWIKKIKRAVGKYNLEEAQRLEAISPKYKLDHLVRERYPSFIDALRDLDDPLTMVHLFACLPAIEKNDVRIPQKMCEMARRLAMEFQAYVARTHSLRRAFISVKGYYYQADVMGQVVTWLVPHQVSQLIPDDVDWVVLTTFLEFYETMLLFVNFKLYHSLSLRYPPVLDKRLSDAAAHLEAIVKDFAKSGCTENRRQGDHRVHQEVSGAVKERLATLPDKIKQLLQEGSQRMEGIEDANNSGSDIPEIDSGSEEEGRSNAKNGNVPMQGEVENVQPEQHFGERDGDSEASEDGPDGRGAVKEEEGEKAAGSTMGVDAHDDAMLCKRLYNGLVFFLGREAPLEPLLFVIRSFGGTVGWFGDGSPVDEADDSITHHVVDRPAHQQTFANREYIQPQWVFDSANARILLPTATYAPGEQLPPHLSPFVDNDEEGYVPEYALKIRRLQEAANMVRHTMSGTDAEQTFVAEAADQDPELEEQTALERAKATERQYLRELEGEMRASRTDATSGQEAAGPLEEEAHMEQHSTAAGGKDRNVEKRTAAQAAADAKAMNEIMIRKKDRWIYKRVTKKEEERKARVAKLKRKRNALSAKRA